MKGPDSTAYDLATKDALLGRGWEKEKANPKCQYCSLQILGTQYSDMRPGIILLKHHLANDVTLMVVLWEDIHGIKTFAVEGMVFKALRMRPLDI